MRMRYKGLASSMLFDFGVRLRADRQGPGKGIAVKYRSELYCLHALFSVSEQARKYVFDARENYEGLHVLRTESGR